MSQAPIAVVAGDFVCTGGMDRANYALASYLARTGRRVELIAHRVGPELASAPNVNVHLVRKPLGSYFLGQWPLSRRGGAIGRAVAAAGGHVVVNGGNCGFPGVNWVHYVHAAYRPDIGSSPFLRLKSAVEHPLNIHAERAALRSARIVVCNSERTRRDVVGLVGVETSRTRVIYYGIDSAQFFPATPSERAVGKRNLGFSSSGPTVLFVGALGDRRKGFDTLFDAWRRLCRAPDWDAELIVVGRGSELPRWIRRVEADEMQSRIRFLGFRTDVAEILRSADALVAPTRYEAYGLGVQEALCCGVPTLVSAGAGVAERYPRDLQDLLLPDPNDSEDLAERLRRWRANEAEWRRRVLPLSQTLREQSWDDMAEQFLAVMDERAD